MLRKLSKSVGIAVSFLSAGSMATAGDLAEGTANPEVEELVIEKQANEGLGIWPIVGLVVIGAIIASSGGNDGGGGKEEPTSPKAE